MASNPFRETEERIATGGLAAWLVRNAEPRTDPNGNVHRLPIEPATNLTGWREALPQPRDAGDPGERLGRWAVLALFSLTTVLAGVFLVLWLTGQPAISPPAAEEAVMAQPPTARLEPVAPSDELRRQGNVAPPSAASVAPPPARAIEPIEPSLNPGDIRALLSRGDALLTAGDVAAARPLLEHAALAGDATAALRLGQSYDPAYLAGARLSEAAGNLGLAIFWYRRGQELGNGTAAFLARKLETAARAGWSATRDPTGRHRP